MEEKKKFMLKRIAGVTIVVLIMLLVFVGIFAASIPAGICAVLFSVLGFLAGYFGRHYKMQKQFFDAFLEKKEDFFNGKIITVTADENGTVAVHAVEAKEETVADSAKESKQPRKKKEEKVQED